MSRSFLTTRTAFLSAIAALVVLLVCVPAIVGQDRNASANESVSGASKDSAATKEDEEDEIKEPPYEPKTKKELQRALSSMQFKVTQNEETEPAFRNKYWDNKKEGVYRCVVCGYSLFSSETKYKSGTGWPSFYAPIKKRSRQLQNRLASLCAETRSSLQSLQGTSGPRV